MAEKVEVDLIVKAITEGFDKIGKDMDKAAKATGDYAKETAKAKRESDDFADAAALVGDKFDDTERSIDKWIDTLGELTPETQKFRGQWEGILESFRTGETDIEGTLGALKKLKVDMQGGEKASKGFNKQLKGMVKGFIGITGAIVAGRAIAKFGKDSLAAAKAAGRLPPIFAEIEKTSANLKEEFGVALARNIEPVLGLVEGLGSLWAEDLRIVNEYNKAVADGVITQEQLNTALGREERDPVAFREDFFAGPQKKERLSDDEKRAFLAKEQARFAKEQTLELRSQNMEQKRIFASSEDVQKSYAASKELTALTNEDLKEMEVRMEAIGRFAELGMERAAQRTGLRQVGPTGGLGGLDLGIASAIQQELDRIDFEQAGGELAQDLFGRLQEQFEAGLIGLESYELSLQNLAIRAAAVQVEVGNITMSEAARQIAKEMNISFQEALDLLNGINTQLDAIGGKSVTATVNIKVKGGVAGEVGGITVPGLGLEDVFAHGGSGIVPPGFPNDSFRVGLTSGESIDVRTPAQQRSQGGGADMSVLEGKFDRLSSDMRNMVLEMTQVMAENR